MKLVESARSTTCWGVVGFGFGIDQSSTESKFGIAVDGVSPLHGSVARCVAGESVDGVRVSAHPVDGFVADVPDAYKESFGSQDAFDCAVRRAR